MQLEVVVIGSHAVGSLLVGQEVVLGLGVGVGMVLAWVDWGGMVLGGLWCHGYILYVTV